MAAQQVAEEREEAERRAAAELAAARAREEAAREAARQAALRDAAERRAAARELATATARLRDVEGELAGLQYASAPPINGAGMSCPVSAAGHFTDTWGAPRSGGRSHQGADVFAPEGSPAYAVADGVIDKVTDTERGLGGITLWLRSDAGDRYYYAHNSVNLVEPGQRVTSGEMIATVGRTGNARTTPPHVHFELHPGGGRAVNPTPLLRQLCG